MRDFAAQLLASDDPPGPARDWSRVVDTGVDEQVVWEWAFLERARLDRVARPGAWRPGHRRPFLDAAERLL